MDERTHAEIQHLKRAVNELSVLNDIATATHVSMSVETIAQVTVERCATYLGASQGAIFVLSEEDDPSEDFKTYVRSLGSTTASLPIHLSDLLKGWMVRHKETITCNDPDADPNFAGAQFRAQGISSFLAVPLLERGTLLGLLVMFNKTEGRAFDDTDARFLGIAGGQIARVLENARLFQRESQFMAQMNQLRMESLAQFVAGLAHELNTPLGAITASTDAMVRATTMLEESLDAMTGLEPSQGQRALKALSGSAAAIQQGSSRIAGIVQRLRQFVRLDQAELQEVDIHDCLEECLALVSARLQPGIEVARAYGELACITCLPAQLNQVFINILMNAADAIANKGTIHVRTRPANETIEVSITDSGTGIPAQHLNKIFSPGFTTKGVKVGTGLGLAICYQIIQAHGGDLNVESEVGTGTTVTVRLPLRQTES